MANCVIAFGMAVISNRPSSLPLRKINLTSNKNAYITIIADNIKKTYW